MVGYIRQSLEDLVFQYMFMEESSHSLWKIWTISISGRMNKAFLIRKLVNLKYNEGTSIVEHLKEVKNIIQLVSMKISLDDEFKHCYC